MKSSRRAWQNCSSPSTQRLFKKAVADVFKKEGKKYAVPGFRKGKAPRALIEKMYGADVFTYDAINELFPEAFEAAVKEAGVEPVGRPEVTVDSADETNGVTLTVKVAVKPEVKVGSYNGLTVERLSILFLTRLLKLS